MKILHTVFLLLISAVAFAGQTTNDFLKTAGVEVIEKKWRVEVRNPALDEDPFRAVNERNQAENDKKEIARQNEMRQRQGKTATLPPAVQMRSMQQAPRDPWTTYFYELKIKNSGDKKIRTVTWDYIFFEPGTEREIGRRRLISDTDINPGKTKNLVVRTAIPPTDTVDAAKAGKAARERYSEQISIFSVEYVDGSVWRSVSN